MEQHVSVLLDETIAGLNIHADGTYVDCTLGAGGHSSHILSQLTKGKLYAFEQDETARKIAEQKLATIGSNFEIISQNFVQLQTELTHRGIKQVDGILFDIGVSSMQLDQAERGFSYRYDSELDMRMNQQQALSAYTVVNEYTMQQLTQIFYEYGEEKFAKSIAKNIVKTREEGPIRTTFELIEVIRKSIPLKVQREKHPAKKVFQAIRIEVNNELHVFTEALEQAIQMLAPKGRLVVITFHSLEDRICKKIFNKYGKIKGPENELEKLIMVEKQAPIKLITRKPIIATEAELADNPRAKSAKLRIIEKI